MSVVRELVAVGSAGLAVKKGTAYMHAWMYAIREFEDAIDDCQTCTANCNEFSANTAGPVHAWDEGVAFYTGSLEGTAQGGNNAGKLAYRLAEKRCKNFGTCSGTGGTTGISNVNHELFKADGLFPKGRDLLLEGKCSEVRPVVNQIVSIMTVPLVQGTLRYAWKTGKIGGADNKPSDQSAKNSAEGSTFAAAALPLVHACDADAAKVVSDNMKFGVAVYDKTTGNFASGTKPDTSAVKAALEKTYSCLGITCAHVGSLLSSDGVTPEAGMEGCDLIAGYKPMGGSVQQHNEIDLDQKAMETALGAADFATAKTHYTQGGESQGSSGARTLQGFSTGAKSKMYDGCPGCPYKSHGVGLHEDEGRVLDGLQFAAAASTNRRRRRARRREGLGSRRGRYYTEQLHFCRGARFLAV